MAILCVCVCVCMCTRERVWMKGESEGQSEIGNVMFN